MNYNLLVLLILYLASPVIVMASVNEIRLLLAEQSAEQSETFTKQLDDKFSKVTEMVEKCVDTKIKEAVDPLSKRQADHEARTAEQFTVLNKAMDILQQTASRPPQSTSHTPLPSNTSSSTPHLIQPQTTPGLPLWDMIQTAERTIGFQPISRADVDDICRIHSISDIEHAMKLLILDYLKFEMKNEAIKIENIVRVFPPQKADWNILYAEFDTRTTTQTVYWYTKFLRDKQHKVMMYVPHPFYAQFDRLSNIAYKYRLPPNTHKTKIRFGQTNLFLQVKPPGSHSWQTVSVPDLPPISTQQSAPDLSLSPSPAPGRPSSSSSKRAASSTPPRLSKASRAGSPVLTAEATAVATGGNNEPSFLAITPTMNH